MNFKFTQKTIKKLKIDFDPNPYDESEIFSWHVNYFNYARKTCLIFMNDKTRYTILVPAVTKKNIPALGDTFKQILEYNLHLDGVESSVIHKYLKDLNEARIVKTDNRSILGQINESLISLSWYFEDIPFFKDTANEELHSRLNHRPMTQLWKNGGCYSSEKMRDELSMIYGEDKS